MTSPDPLDRAMALAAQGSVVPAYRLLEQAMTAGDGLAAGTLAEWRMAGHLVRRDIGLARDLFGRAAELGLREALPMHVALLASGAGGKGRDWARARELLAKSASSDPQAARQAALLDGMTLTEAGDPAGLPRLEPLNERPFVARAPGFLAAEECRYLTELAQPYLQPSVVVDPVSQRFITDPVRLARSAGFPFVLENPVLHALNRRIAALTQTRYEQGEPLQVLSYRAGEQYKLHSDVLPGPVNQRVLTVLVTLTDDFTGGETEFPDLGIRWRGQVGEALVFANVDERGHPAPTARHAGKPVVAGTKTILSKWIRQAPLDISGPPGRPL